MTEHLPRTLAGLRALLTYLTESTVKETPDGLMHVLAELPKAPVFLA